MFFGEAIKYNDKPSDKESENIKLISNMIFYENEDNNANIKTEDKTTLATESEVRITTELVPREDSFELSTLFYGLISIAVTVALTSILLFLLRRNFIVAQQREYVEGNHKIPLKIQVKIFTKSR